MGFIEQVKYLWDSFHLLYAIGGAIVILVTTWLIWHKVIYVLYRLGNGLQSRKIAIFADDEYSSLSSMLTDSKIFGAKNILKINKNDIDKARNANIFLVYWPEFSDKIDAILNNKSDSTALIIYTPNNIRIDDDSFKRINEKRNAIIVNVRGRLLNDIFTSMVTTGYEQ